MVGIELMEMLVPPSQRSSPEWLSYCKLIQLVHNLLQPSISRAEVKEAARLDLEHAHLYQRVRAKPRALRCSSQVPCVRVSLA